MPSRLIWREFRPRGKAVRAERERALRADAATLRALVVMCSAVVL
jgi:hypothetical protein